MSASEGYPKHAKRARDPNPRAKYCYFDHSSSIAGCAAEVLADAAATETPTGAVAIADDDPINAHLAVAAAA